MIHPTADVKSNSIGPDTKIWQYTVVLEGATIGSNCNINCHVFIENDVIIGNNVTVKSSVQIWDGIRIENNVFIGPNVTFTNDSNPRSKQYPESFQKTEIKENASLGAASVILGGVTIGRYAMTGAGTIVTKNVPDRALFVGSPGKVVGWLNDDGSKMQSIGELSYRDNKGAKWKVVEGILLKV